MSFRLHIIAMPHVQVNSDFLTCAYTQKDVKALKMFGKRGHEVTLYANEGSENPYGEVVQILTEKERSGFFGAHTPTGPQAKQYDLQWDPSKPYWQLFNSRAATALLPRVQKGDFVLSLSGVCHKPIADQIPGSASGIAQTAMWVEYGIGYYGTFSRYRIFESQTHRSWCMGRADVKVIDRDTEVINNFFDLDQFPRLIDTPPEPYYLFIGRIIDTKGWRVAVEVTRDLGARLLIAGQGDPGPIPPHVTFVGAVGAEERCRLMTNAIATFAPTEYLEPFGGVAVEAQLCGTPCITTDAAAFTEIVEQPWRCSSHREFVTAAKAAARLSATARAGIREQARRRWSLDAIAPQYERYFQRLTDRFGAGYYAA